jgi:hypothetical protein
LEMCIDRRDQWLDSVAGVGSHVDGLRGNDDGDQRWCDCGRILLVGFSFGVFDSSSSLTSLHLKSELQPRGRVATMTGDGRFRREDFRRRWSCTSSPQSSSSESELPVFFMLGRLFGMGRRELACVRLVLVARLAGCALGVLCGLGHVLCVVGGLGPFVSVFVRFPPKKPDTFFLIN